MFEALWTIARDLLGGADRLRALRAEKRNAVAEFVSGFATCISGITSAVRAEQRIDSGMCAELGEYAFRARAVLSGALTDGEVEVIVNKLRSARSLRETLAQLGSGLGARTGVTFGHRDEAWLTADEYLTMLDETAGYFRATANILKAG